jgi:hypothetical protein
MPLGGYLAHLGGYLAHRKRQVMQTYAPKWGDEAAEDRWKMTCIQMTGLPLALLGGASLLVRGELGLDLLAAFVVVGAPLALMMFVLLRRMNMAASEALGVRVTGKADSAPPAKSPDYEAWCEKHGITPYAASAKFGSARHPD